MNLNKETKRETLLGWSQRNGYSIETVAREWRDGRLAPTHHTNSGYLVVEPCAGLKLHELKPGARRSADIGSPAASLAINSSESSLQARLDPRGHDREARIAAAKREHAEHDRRRSSRPRANAAKGAEPVSLGNRIRSKQQGGR